MHTQKKYLFLIILTLINFDSKAIDTANSALLAAVKTGHLAQVTAALNNHEYVNIQDSTNLWTPLMYATYYKYKDILTCVN